VVVTLAEGMELVFEGIWGGGLDGLRDRITVWIGHMFFLTKPADSKELLEIE